MATTANVPKSHKELPTAVIKQMAALATSGFGLVAALAWNAVIQELIATYIKPYIGQGSGLVSLLIYAVIITFLAVTITLYLARLEAQVDTINEKLRSRFGRRLRQPQDSTQKSG